MSRVFISYRRDDTQGVAGRLYDDLVDRLGESRVFRDVDGIDPGRDFVQVLEEALEEVSVLVVLIGKRWASVEDSSGRRRLDLADDLVRMEITRALARDIAVMPVLVEGARLPKPDDLPADLEPLCRRQYLELTDKRWDFDVGQIVAGIRTHTGMGSFHRRRLLATGLAGVGGAIALLAGWRVFAEDSAAEYTTSGCKPGYVWREAFPGDSVCVVKEQADQAKLDNAAASSRVDPDGDHGPQSCLQGYVWRVARESDLVCVEPEVRERVLMDNQTAHVRAATTAGDDS